MENRVLIVDDEESITELLTNYLSARGFECDATNSPFEAIEHLQQTRYALLLTDLRMPRMSGMELLRKAKEIDPDLSVVVVSAMVEITNAIDAMRVGADDYILKPFNLSEITLAVTGALEKRRQMLDNRSYQEELSARVESATEELERVNRELRKTKEYLENLLHSTVDAIITFDRTHRISFANRGAQQMFGFGEGELDGLPAARLFAGGDAEIGYIERILQESGRLQNYESEMIRKDGDHLPVSISLSYVTHADGELASTLAICKDITQQKQLENELKEMSIKDSLTGLYNQGHFYDRLKAEIERARRQGHPLSLLLFDVDQFKSYNDCHGHLEGDRVLKEVARVVRDCTRDHVDIAFRYGGDEFTVILPEADERQARIIAERIRRSFEAKKFDQLTLSVGLMSYRESYSLRSFIQFADAMMYDAKRAGGNQVHIYSMPAAKEEAAEETKH